MFGSYNKYCATEPGMLTFDSVFQILYHVGYFCQIIIIFTISVKNGHVQLLFLH